MVKSAIGFLLLIFVSGCATSHPSFDLARAPLPSAEDQSSGSVPPPPSVIRSGPQMAEYSYAAGCYQAYQRICGKLLTDIERSACQDDGLSVCEKYGHQFGEWIHSGHAHH
jgi:hypothetical protein